VRAASIIGLVVLALVSLCIAPCVPHSLKLTRLERKYRGLQHPPSRALAYESDLGLLEGNGNHCDYFVGELRASTLSVAELTRAYGAAAEVEDVSLADPLDVSEVRRRLYLRAKEAALLPGERLYVVSMFEQEAPGLDLRCH
jgi:hypothetical protein